jgi:MFS family permease
VAGFSSVAASRSPLCSSSFPLPGPCPCRCGCSAPSAAMIAVMNLCNSLVQALTPDAVRGRVMGLYTWVFFGFMPLGALLAGTAAEYLGEHVTVALGAAATLACSAAIALVVPRLRRLD